MLRGILRTCRNRTPLKLNITIIVVATFNTVFGYFYSNRGIGAWRQQYNSPAVERYKRANTLYFRVHVRHLLSIIVIMIPYKCIKNN